ncbi:hypothetical protein [Pseudomonas sp. PH1b]|uniref:hypothetical protein n=1 Tax=Pseudomonas sp. PH1b TaxID=1397282 RepID=UPI0004692880|nr:hypothetical protein [Pseudomonas sp. PH1b]
MAIRKKSEIIHLRVEPQSKLLLEGLANLGNTTATRTIERLLMEAAESTQVAETEVAVSESVFTNGGLTLKAALELALVDRNPIIIKLRLSYLANDALNTADQFITLAIISSKTLFGGEEEIFTKAEGILKIEEFDSVPRVDTDKIAANMDFLESYADFRIKNPSIMMSYKEYLKASTSDKR